MPNKIFFQQYTEQIQVENGFLTLSTFLSRRPTSGSTNSISNNGLGTHSWFKKPEKFHIFNFY